MLIKLLGVIVVIFSASLIGYYFSKLTSYREEDLREMEKAIALWIEEARYGATPMIQAFWEIGERATGVVSQLFLQTSNGLEKKTEETAGKVWEKVWDQVKKDSYFNREDETAIVAFGKGLGHLDAQHQRNHAEMLLHYLKREQERLAAKKDKEGKLYLRMGTLMGILISVVLF